MVINSIFSEKSNFANGNHLFARFSFVILRPTTQGVSAAKTITRFNQTI